MTSTISQCQMLNEPMTFQSSTTLLIRGVAGSPFAQGRGPPSRHACGHAGLPGRRRARIHHDAESVRHAEFAHQRAPARSCGRASAVALVGVVHRGDVLLRDDQHVHRRPGRDVVEHQQFVILVGLAGRDLPATILQKMQLGSALMNVSSDGHRFAVVPAQKTLDDAVDGPDRVRSWDDEAHQHEHRDEATTAHSRLHQKVRICRAKWLSYQRVPFVSSRFT